MVGLRYLKKEKYKYGDFIRTNDGIIDKIKTINKYGTVTKYDDKEDKISVVTNYYINSGLKVNEDDIVKHSKNLIDLLQEGDYANGYKVIAKSDDGYIVILTDDIDQGELLTEEEIETILTKEQYQANCYTVERKE